MILTVLNIINMILGILFVMCYAFQFIYLFIPFLMKLPKHKDAELHKFAIIVSARNEENVINNLFDSIDAQDYPRDLITVALVADNCTDNTAEVAEARGNVKVYRRHSDTEKGKGYALNYLLGKLDEDFGEDAFDAFIVFDADNILTRSYISEINKTFSDGYEVVMSYRNSKNYGDGWLAAGSGLWFIRESKYLNGSRMRIGACPQCSGTGFLFSNEIKKENGGWPFHTLTEDYEFTCHSVVRGKKFGYCEQAMFYDEQVAGFRQSWRQRIRWTKGGLQGFIKYGGQLVRGLFSKKFIACYDMLMSIAPAYILSLVACMVNIVGAVLLIATGSDFWDTVLPMLKMVIGAYTILLIQSIVATSTEWKKIHAHPVKKVLYAFTFPFFILTFIPICFIAIFKKVEWKPIKHTSLNSDDVEKVIFETDKKNDETQNEN